MEESQSSGWGLEGDIRKKCLDKNDLGKFKVEAGIHHDVTNLQ
jgi:hypothetical protein